MKRILLIDDEKINHIVIKRVLEKEEDFSVDSAYSADEGVALAKEKEFDYILLDVEMPDKNGFDAAPLLMEVTNAPIAFFTGHVDDDVCKKATDLGVAGIIEKPVTKEKLLEIFLS